MQGFRKADPDQWEFSNEFFIKDRKDLLKGIHRRKNLNSNAQGHDSLVVGNSAIEVRTTVTVQLTGSWGRMTVRRVI